MWSSAKGVVLPIFAILVLTLSLLNLEIYFKNNSPTQTPKQNVLSASIQSEESFWQDFLATNPTYLPGWIELARLALKKHDPSLYSFYLEKAREIDPNFQTNLDN